MDKIQIAEIASKMSDREDLLNLLNLIKHDFGSVAGKFYPFTMKQLLYYCNPNHTHHRYRSFRIKKKSGGFRQITAPRNQTFMLILQAVNELLKAIYTPSDYANGFVDGKSIVDNASVHKGQRFVFNIDLKDFFPSIVQARVWGRLQVKPFDFPKSIANLIAGLCAMKKIEEDEKGQKKATYVLPQGAPTSPIITNMICDKLDHRLAGLAKRFGVHYSRYADDITFSSMHNVYGEKDKFREELARIITGQGFVINEAKTRLQKLGNRQEVTGIIVSEKLNVSREYVRDIRNILYIWDRYGFTAAMSKFIPRYKEQKGHVKKGVPDIQSVIEGKLLYLKMVKGENDSVYLKLQGKFSRIIERDFSVEKRNKYGVSYIETLPIPTFETKYNTTVKLVISGAKRYGSFLLESKRYSASIEKELSSEEVKDKGTLLISNCKSSDRKQFWLIHTVNKCFESQNSCSVNEIDELSKELDLLLNM